MTIRPATPQDIPAIVELERQAPELAHWSEEIYRKVFEPGAPERLLLVGEGEGRLHGFLVARFTAGVCELENIIVAPKKRRQGTATELLRALVTAVSMRGAQQILLEVRESNTPARSLYSEFGFKETGRRKNYYNDPAEDAILYALAPVLVQNHTRTM